MKIKNLALTAAICCALTAVGKQADIHYVEGVNRPQTKMTTPISINIATPIGLPWGHDWNVYGVQLGGFNETEEVRGLQIGFINVTDYFTGVQIGGINVTKRMYGLQIGFVNVINECDVPFLPVLNWNF